MCYKVNQPSTGSNTAEEIFDFGMYLGFFDEQRKSFMTELCKTQNFITFVEKSHRAKEEKNDYLFFVEGVKLCSEKGEKALAKKVKKITDQLLNNFKHVVLTYLN